MAVVVIVLGIAAYGLHAYFETPIEA